MTEKPVKKAQLQNPPHGPESNLPTAAAPTRSGRKKIPVSAVLAVIGLALLAVGLAMYPRRAEAPAPISENVSVAGDSYVMSHMSYVNYTVDQIHPDPRQRMRILVDRFIYQGLRYAPSRHAARDQAVCRATPRSG